MATLNFEMQLRILLEQVVGWDTRSDESFKEGGFFGIVDGPSHAIEEQGRKTLHVHMTLWIRGHQDLQRQVFFGNFREEIR